MPPKKAPGGKKNAYSMAPVIPAGEVVSNFQKKQWRIGKSFASGGFGRLYLAEEIREGGGKSKQKCVVKMEPAENGPLFQETHVYQRIAKPEMLESWKKTKGVKFLGIPAFLGSGRHLKDKFQYRFLVIPQFGPDLESLRSRSPVLPPEDVFRAGKCILHSLEYLHSVHDMGSLVLVDFGLAKRVADTPVFHENPKKAHDGTLIFTSLDAHKGAAPSYRGDVEILAYNILYWLTGSLTWIKDTNPMTVAKKKTEFSESLEKSLKSQLPGGAPYLSDLLKFFQNVYGLDYAEKADFQRLQALLTACGKKAGGGRVSSPKKAGGGRASSPKKKRSTSLKRKVEALKVDSSDSEEDVVVEKTPSPEVPKKKKTGASVAKKAKVSAPDRSSEPSTSSSGRGGVVIPGLANMAPVLRNGTNGPVLIPTAIGTGRRKSVGEALVKKYVGKERSKKTQGPPRKTTQRKTKAQLVEEETQTSPGMWGGPIKAKK